MFWNFFMKTSFSSKGRPFALSILQNSSLSLSQLRAFLRLRMKSMMNLKQDLLTLSSISRKNLPSTQSIGVVQTSFQNISSYLRCLYQYYFIFRIKSRYYRLSFPFFSAYLSFWAAGKYTPRQFLSCSMLFCYYYFSIDSISSSSSFIQGLSAPACASSLNPILPYSALPLCLVLIWVYKAGQLRQDFPQEQVKVLPSSSFLVLLLRLDYSLLSQLCISLRISAREPMCDQLIE